MQRSHEKEWMDLGPPFYTPDEYEDALCQLARIGRYLGGNRASFWAFDQIRPHSILDVGCGGGFLAILLGKKYPQAQVFGIDVSEQAIAFAKRQAAPPNVTFAVSSQLKPVDVITATLVCHHMSDEELIQFLKQAYQLAEKAIILNDLHRNCLAIIGFWIVSRLFFRNRMVQHDGILSIRRSLTRSEWQERLKAANIPPERYSLTWHWAFRWIVWIQK